MWANCLTVRSNKKLNILGCKSLALVKVSFLKNEEL